jgi:histidinol phosphatase-like PHP family hydrolase
MPCGHAERTDAIVGSISDEDFRACFTAAAQAGVSIEITTGFFPSLRSQDGIEGWQDETFLRVLHLAKACGCHFHFASDAHSLAAIGSVLRLAPFVDELGLTERDIHPRFRPAH